MGNKYFAFAFLQIFSAILVSIAHADVSHLAGQQHAHHHHHQPAQQGYQYAAPHVPQYPATASDAASSSYNGLVNSYVPPPSGGSPRYVPPGTESRERSQSYLNTPTGPTVYQQQQYQQSLQNQQYQQTNVNQYSSGSASTSYGAGQGVSAYSSGQAQQYYPQQKQTPIVTKHFYVHAAPEDPEENAGPRFVQIGQPRKNYKVIFIKAPTYGSSSQIIPILPPNEEKTIVYVLSKKPTFNQNIQLPEQPVTEPSKPDVFFIKYKTAEEAAAAQEKIQGELFFRVWL